MRIYLEAIEKCPETGDLVINLPKELCDQVGWKIGDDLIWQETTVCEDHGEYKGFSIRKSGPED